jgi:superfamily II DNA or RNA helicase
MAKTVILSNRLYLLKDYARFEYYKPFRYVLDYDEEEDWTVENWRDFGEFIGFCRGDIGKIQETFKEFKIKDQRAIVPFPEEYPLKFTGHLTEEQKDVWKDWIKHGYGIVKAPPRWGKTIWSIFMMCKLKQRALVVMHRIDLLNQWLEEMRAWTNLAELEEEAGKPLAGIWMTWEDDFPLITLTNYQWMLNATGQAHLKKIRDMFGLVWVDECHTVVADGYNRVVNKLNSYYRGGVTATPYRSKDGLHVIIQDVLGPVIAEGITEALPVRYNYVWTEHHVAKFYHWATFVRRLVQDEDRTELIAKWVAKDIQEGHHVLVTTDRVDHSWALQELIQLKCPDIKVEVVNGGVLMEEREAIWQRCRRGETKVLVGMNKII